MSFDLIVNNFWLILILGSVYSAFLLKFRSRKFIQKEPDLREGYHRLFVGELIFLNIPWVIAGIGIIFGGVPSTLSYLAPNRGNLFVLAFQVSIVALCVWAFWWVFLRGGAQFLAEHPGVFGAPIKSPSLIKVIVGATIIFGIAAVVAMARA